jgi:uncharacterized metal-binding protein
VCPECVRSTLARHGVEPDVHHRLSSAGVRKWLGEDFDPDQAEQVLGDLALSLERGLLGDS